MSRILKDKDMVFFLNELQHTPAGVRYRKSWDEAQQALKAIYRLKGNNKINEITRNAIRRAYIKSSEHASACLAGLSSVHHWPPESQADAKFIYQPPSRAQRLSRKAP